MPRRWRLKGDGCGGGERGGVDMCAVGSTSGGGERLEASGESEGEERRKGSRVYTC